MRGDLALHLRMALRPSGVIGALIAVIGFTVCAAVYLPWYEIEGRVAMLGGAHAGRLAALAGWEAQPWIWVIAVLGAVVVAVGVALVVDRPPSGCSELLLALAVSLALVTGISAVLTPPTGRFGAQSQLEDYQAIAPSLPDDVTVRVTVQPAPGVWIALACAALLLLAAFATREV